VLAEEVENDVGQTEKTPNAFAAQAVHDSMVSEYSELCEYGRQKGQSPAITPTDGPKGRMATLIAENLQLAKIPSPRQNRPKQMSRTISPRDEVACFRCARPIPLVDRIGHKIAR